MRRSSDATLPGHGVAMEHRNPDPPVVNPRVVSDLQSFELFLSLLIAEIGRHAVLAKKPIQEEVAATLGDVEPGVAVDVLGLLQTCLEGRNTCAAACA